MSKDFTKVEEKKYYYLQALEDLEVEAGNKDKPDKYKRMSSAAGIRKKPTARQQRELLEKQENKCFYCGRELGSMYERDGKIKYLRTHFDHRLPFSYLQGNPEEIFVAACHICNSIKSNKMFHSREEVVDYVTWRAKKKGIAFPEDLSSVQEEICS